MVVIGLVLATVLLLTLAYETRRVLTWIVIAVFFAVALHPAVSLLDRRIGWMRRWLATLLVFLLAFAFIAGLVTVFVIPLVREGTQLADDLPALIADIRAGRGPVGDLAERFHVLDYAQSHSAQIRGYLSGLGAPTLAALQGAATGVAGALTVFVLSYLMVLEAPKVISGFLALFPEHRAERIRRVSHDCARTVTGYITGNLLISLICGLLTYLVLAVLGVPFAGLIALFVGLADLIPLVGATLGAVVAVLAAFTDSVVSGLVVLAFFVLYQQLENHLLQPLIFARTVQLNPLTVLLAILIGVELAGILGALLAIPVAGILQIIARDIWDTRRGRLKPEPTVGEDRTTAPDPA
ncbi:AI-2E family transporter [Amorphoplanes nipponensis]|uniref:AI-2E family transporter n=2 Tax=Actinoplanes nipponensis TaxID=135950 RepID=A0A919JG19_9ACTN|nr:AI-2E family transporter [Actinoplanes nipponensis]